MKPGRHGSKTPYINKSRSYNKGCTWVAEDGKLEALARLKVANVPRAIGVGGEGGRGKGSARVEGEGEGAVLDAFRS